MLLICVFLSLFSVSFGDWNWYQVLPNDPSTLSPTPRYHHTFAEIGNNTGVLQGGFNLNTQSYLNDTWIYLADDKNWKQVESSTAKVLNRAYATSNTYNKEVVLYGGQGPAGSFDDVWRFSLENPVWQQDTYSKVPPEVAKVLARQYHGAAIVESTGKMYVFGGRVGSLGHTSNDLLSYDLNTKEWALIIDDGATGSPLEREGHSFTFYDDKKLGPVLILFGGYSDEPYTGGFNDTWRFIIGTNKWEQITGAVNVPEGRYGHDAAIAGDTLIIYGGISTHNIDFPPTFDIFYSDIWTLLLNDESLTWNNDIPNDAPTGPGARQGQQVALLNGYFTNTGGYVQYFGVVNDVWYLIDN